METYYYINGKVFKSSELDKKRKKMFESRGFLSLTLEELQVKQDAIQRSMENFL